MKKILHFVREYWKDPKIRLLLFAIWMPVLITLVWIAVQVHSTRTVTDLAHFMGENRVNTMAAVLDERSIFDGQGKQFGPVKINQVYLDPPFRAGWPVIVADMDMNTVQKGWWNCVELDESGYYLCQSRLNQK